MRLFNSILIIILLGLSAVLLQAQERPNIVLIMTDDQGWADIGRNRELHSRGDKIQTPVLDELSQRSLWFTRAYAAAPVCSPTRASVITGRHPYRAGVLAPGFRLRTQEPSIARDLAGIGYATGHFGKWHLEGQSGTGEPVSAANDHNPAVFGFTDWASITNYYDLDPTFGTPDGKVTTSGEGSVATVEQASAFMADKVKARTPFFAVIWFGSPHTPHEPSAEDLKACGGDKKLAEIRGIDRAVGLLYSRLEQMGIADDTLLWFTSDNGSQNRQGNGGLRGSKNQIWEGGLRVPAFIHWPQRFKPRTIDVPIVTSDIRPTLLALTGARTHQSMPVDGVNLLPILLGKADRRPSPVMFWAGVKGSGRNMTPEQGHAAIVDGQWKLHRVADSWALYDLADDPQEKRNVSSRNKKFVAYLRGQLEGWQATVVASNAGKDY